MSIYLCHWGYLNSDSQVFMKLLYFNEKITLLLLRYVSFNRSKAFEVETLEIYFLWSFAHRKCFRNFIIFTALT